MTTRKQNFKTLRQNKCIAMVNTATVSIQNWLLRY